MKKNPALFQEIDLYWHKSPQLFTSENIDSAETSKIPSNWIKAVKSDSVNDALEIIWGNDEVGKMFQSALYEIDGVAILTSENLPPSLIYWWEDGKDIRTFEGKLPLDENDVPENLKFFYEKLPDNFKHLYKTHNGLQMVGIIIQPVQQWEWNLGTDWDPGAGVHYKLNLDDMLQIFSNEAGILLCLDREYSTIYFDLKNPEEPRFDVNFWNELRRFIDIHFENRQPYQDSASDSENSVSQSIYKSVSDLDFPFTVKTPKMEIAIAIMLLIIFGFGLTAFGILILFIFNVSIITIVISVTLVLIGIFISITYLFTYAVKAIFYKDKIKKFFFIGKKEIKSEDINSIARSFRQDGKMFIKISTTTGKSVEIDQNHTDYNVFDLCDKLQSLYACYRNTAGSPDYR